MLKHIMITEDEWLLIHDLKKILTYFAEVTDYLGRNIDICQNLFKIILAIFIIEFNIVLAISGFRYFGYINYNSYNIVSAIIKKILSLIFR